MYLILLGPPGAGKGTQAERLARETGLAHVATGDLFRENVRNGTDLGQTARAYMDRGELVPDEVTIRMLLERLDRPDARAGAMLDGFPRTVEQARALDTALAGRRQQVDKVLLIDVRPEEVRRRLSGRWTCPADATVYHAVNRPPRQAGRCDLCGAALIQRDDDTPEAIARRLQVYADQTAPLIDYYTRARRLVRVAGEQDVNAVSRDLLAAVGSRA